MAEGAMTPKCVVCGEELVVLSTLDDRTQALVEKALWCDSCGLQYAQRPSPQAPRQS